VREASLNRCLEGVVVLARRGARVVGSVDLEGLCALRVFRCLDVERSALHPRGEQGERGEVAVLIGQVLKLALGEGCADGGAVCLERGRGGGDGDTRVAACGLEDEVYLRGAVVGDDDVIALAGGKPVAVALGVWDKTQDGVVAVVFRLDGLRSTLAYIYNYYGCIWDHRASCWVGSGADDRAEDGLSLHARAASE
jgi:hypothetical protein